MDAFIFVINNYALLEKAYFYYRVASDTYTVVNTTTSVAKFIGKQACNVYSKLSSNKSTNEEFIVTDCENNYLLVENL